MQAGARLIGLACLFSLALSARAQHPDHDASHAHSSDKQDDHRQDHPYHNEPAAAHVHGHATLTLVMEGDALEVNLDSAAANLLGFERRAASNAERQQLAQAEQQLRSADARLRLQGGRCQLLDMQLDLSGFQPLTETAPPDTPVTPVSQHRDIALSYRYRCQRPETLQGITTDLMTVFPALTSLSVQWIIRGRQGAITLDNRRDHVTFR